MTEPNRAEALDPKRVFLVSGQQLQRKIGGRDAPGAAIQQRVVIADDVHQAQLLVGEADPSFVTQGLASLHDYEDAARRLRAVAAGRSDEWPLLQAR